MVRLDVVDAAHTRAVPVPGVTGYMESAAAGGYLLLGVGAALPPDGAGLVLAWAAVLIGPTAGPGAGGSGSDGGAGVEVVADVGCDSGGLRVEHGTLTGYVLVNGARLPVVFALSGGGASG